MLGSAGGGGAPYSASCSYGAGGKGGDGGGIIAISAANVAITGTVTSSGNNGAQGGDYAGGGGGGAGGSVLIRATTLALGSNITTAVKGNGGNSSNNGGGTGGAGGNGRIAVSTGATGTTNPTFTEVSPGATYATDNPYVVNANALDFTSLYTFIPTLSSDSVGTIQYQVSSNNGTTWYYYTSGAWSTTTGGFEESSSGSVISANIGTLPPNTRQFKFKAFLNSDRASTPKLDGITINYHIPPSAPTTLTPPFSARTTTSVTWRFTDNSATEGQFKVKEDNTVKGSVDSTTILTTGGIVTYQENDLVANTQYTRLFVSTDGVADSADSASVSTYTLANPAGTPVVTQSPDATSLVVVLSQNSNPANTTYAFGLDDISDGSVDSGGYVQADGSLGAVAVWETYDNWGGDSGRTVTGLTPNSTHNFIAKQRTVIMSKRYSLVGVVA